jgi:hypothetical protein
LQAADFRDNVRRAADLTIIGEYFTVLRQEVGMAGRPTKEPGQRMNVPLRIMLTAQQDALIREAAKRHGADVSGWARPILVEAAKRSVGRRHSEAPEAGRRGPAAEDEQLP